METFDNRHGEARYAPRLIMVELPDDPPQRPVVAMMRAQVE